VSRWLLCARDLTESESLPLTQECLAQMIGVQRNAVSIVANALQKAGIISYSRGQIEITNVAGLRETACECYEAVKARRDRLLKPSKAILNGGWLTEFPFLLRYSAHGNGAMRRANLQFSLPLMGARIILDVGQRA